MGYPNYNEIMNDRERRRRQEMEGGRQRTLKIQGEGLLERLCLDMKLKGKITLNADEPDPRQWTVTVSFIDLAEDMNHTESFWDFPTPEFMSKKMLLNK
jgi:hypothetical protein